MGFKEELYEMANAGLRYGIGCINAAKTMSNMQIGDQVRKYGTDDIYFIAGIYPETDSILLTAGTEIK